jgi:hypothetical protein
MANAMLAPLPDVRQRRDAVPRVQHVVTVLVQSALMAAALGVLAAYVVLAVAHVNDRYQINFCSSAYASLAAYVNHGVFYPELYDGVRYGGTRYMPLEFTLHAGLARLTGEYLVSGKLLAYFLTLVVSLELWCIARGLRCPQSVALATISLILLTQCGLLAFTTIRGDLLPVACQLAALLLVRREVTQTKAALASVLCAGAFLAKFSAVWAALAIAVYLLVHHRRCLPAFLGVAVVSVGLALLACHWLSAGRMQANFAALSVAGVSTKDVALAPMLLLWKLGRSGTGVTFLVPAMIVEAVAAAYQRRATVFHYGLYACLLTTLVVYTDRGSDTNHLLDVVILAAVMCASLWGALPPVGERTGGIRVGVGLALVWVLFSGSVNMLVFPVLGAIRSVQEHRVEAEFVSPPLSDLFAGEGPVLSEDAWVELSAGRLPTISDAYSLARMSAAHPELAQPLVQRVEAREFRYVILLQRLDAKTPPTDRYQWEDRAFGRQIVAALRQNYELLGEREGYFIYIPGHGSVAGGPNR